MSLFLQRCGIRKEDVPEFRARPKRAKNDDSPCAHHIYVPPARTTVQNILEEY
jgi:hypothetical protein